MNGGFEQRYAAEKIRNETFGSHLSNIIIMGSLFSIDTETFSLHLQTFSNILYFNTTSVIPIKEKYYACAGNVEYVLVPFKTVLKT